MLILNAVDRSEQSKQNIAKEFGLPRTTLSTIIKNRSRIENHSKEYTLTSIKGRKRLRGGKHEELELQLMKQLGKLGDENKSLTYRFIKNMASKLAISMGVTDFNFSYGWLHRIKKQHKLILANQSIYPIPPKNDSKLVEESVSLPEDDKLSQIKYEYENNKIQNDPLENISKKNIINTSENNLSPTIQSKRARTEIK